MASKPKPKASPPPAVTLADLHGDPQNARKHNPRNIGAVQASLQEYGAARSIVIDENNQIIAGHGVVEAAALAGMERVQVVDADGETIIAVRRTGLTKKQKQELGIADNRAGDLSEWDGEMLASLMGDVDMGKFFSDEELAELIPATAGNDAEDPGAQIDRAAELQAKWGTALGQLWQIGRHRLLVGDCTVAENVARLMGGEKAGAVVTDPPYGINREGIENDDPEGLRALFDGCLAVLPADNAVVIAFQSPRLEWVWLDATRDAGHKLERLLWMYKPADETFPWRGWLLTSEAIRITSVGKPEWADVHPYSHDCYSPTTIGKELESGEGWHASVKPLAVVVDLTQRTSGDVYDPFCGSGTTLVACEKLGRSGRGCELSPAYAAVTLERLAGLGLTPVLVGNA